MGVIVWLLIPLAAVIVAMIWTAALARSERRRADERWRAQRLAELGSVLAATATPAVATGKQDADPSSVARSAEQSSNDVLTDE